MYHTIILAGRLSAEPNLRYTPAGKAVCNFNVAVDDGYGDKKKTVWFRVTAWDKTAENVNQYLGKGSQVLIEGRMNPDENGGPIIWERSDGTPAASYEITASTVRFLGGKGEPKAEQSDDFDFNDF